MILCASLLGCSGDLLLKHPLAAPCARCPSSSGVSQLLCFLRLGLFFPSCVGDKKDASPTTPQLHYYKITQQSPVVAGNDKCRCHQRIMNCCASPFLKKHPALSLTLDTPDALWLFTPPSLILLELLCCRRCRLSLALSLPSEVSLRHGSWISQQPCVPYRSCSTTA